MTRILGFDPGYGRLGFGVIDVDRGKTKAVTFGVITTKATDEKGVRLKEIAHDARLLLKKYAPDCVAIEEIFFAKSTTTALKVAEVRGVLFLLSEEALVPVVEVKPVEVKKALTGYGQADKQQMQSMVKTIFSLDKIPKPDDAADALAIAWTGAAKYTSRV